MTRHLHKTSAVCSKEAGERGLLPMGYLIRSLTATVIAQAMTILSMKVSFKGITSFGSGGFGKSQVALAGFPVGTSRKFLSHTPRTENQTPENSG